MELGKNAHKGPSQPCGFMELSIKKKNKKEQESVPGREIVCMFFSSAKSDHKKH